MASPRVTKNVLRLSPHSISRVKRNTRSPRTPIKNTLGEEDAYRNLCSTINVDTPNRKKIINQGLFCNKRNILGSGSFGTVFKASYKGGNVAAKIIKRTKRTDITVDAEKLAASLRHANIIKILGVDQGDALSMITMELCGTSLQTHLEKGALIRSERIFIFGAIATALRFCHDAGVVHADVKPKNILIAANGQPKLTDFGNAVFIKDACDAKTFRGTPGYAAPEVVRGSVPTPASDIYSLGIVAWQILARQYPFSGLHVHTILYMTGKGARPSDAELIDEFCGIYKDLYRRMWDENPENRPNLTSVINTLDILRNQS